MAEAKKSTAVIIHQINFFTFKKFSPLIISFHRCSFLTIKINLIMIAITERMVTTFTTAAEAVIIILWEFAPLPILIVITDGGYNLFFNWYRAKDTVGSIFNNF